MFDDRPDRDAEIVFVGRSNVGKSTVLRELTGHSFTTGRRPGVTQSPNYYDWEPEGFLLTDLPGFGFMEGVPEERREAIKTDIVRYLEEYADRILVGVLVIDANSAVEIIDRYADRGEIPYDLDMHRLLLDLDIPTVLAVNKIDKVDDPDGYLDNVADRFGFLPPWQQWQDQIAPIAAKHGRIEPLTEAIRNHLHEASRDDLLKFF